VASALSDAYYALGYPIERPKSLTTAMLEEAAAKAADRRTGPLGFLWVDSRPDQAYRRPMGSALVRRSFQLALLLVALSIGSSPSAQDCGDLFDPYQVLNFHVTMDPADWTALTHSCPAGICGPEPHYYWNAIFRCEN
jgi:hypothetical protein